MSMLPINRIPEILKRMDLNINQAEAMKTCFGILAIMSREDANKTAIAKDGMEVMLNAMTSHIDRTDVQEAGCDLLWSLAFNSNVVKEIIAKYNGAVVLVRALKRHTRSPDFLKSACGALSNICQWRQNQEAVASQGGLQPLVGSIHIHQTNAKLLPFIFDAIASIIVNNEENARNVSSLGIIPVIVGTLNRHKASKEVVKSGCHTLAILSDVKGQASKIAFAGGVPIILSLLDLHPLYSDLHRVAAVVLLRMIQGMVQRYIVLYEYANLLICFFFKESSHVGREICCHEGVRILLQSLEKGGSQQDTVAAVTHILYTITNPNSPAVSAIETQLWLQPQPISENSDIVERKNGDSEANQPPRAESCSSGEVMTKQSSLGGIAYILGQYSSRRDVVRAACRLVLNIIGFPGVVDALCGLDVLDRILECISIHRDTKDIIEAAVSMIKNADKAVYMHRVAHSAKSVQGLLNLFQVKLNDEDVVCASAEICKQLLDKDARITVKEQYSHDMPKRPVSGLDLSENSDKEEEKWYLQAVTICLAALNLYGNISQKDTEESSSSINCNKVLNCLADFIFLCLSTERVSFDDERIKEAVVVLQNWSQKYEPERLKMFIYLEEKLSNKPTQDGNSSSDQRDNSENNINQIMGTIEDLTVTNSNHTQSLENSSRSASKTVLTDSQNGKLLPYHPLKALGSKGRLLECWPNYLERLLSTSDKYNPPPSAAIEADQHCRMHLCYESLRPGGRSVVSRCPTPVPYYVPMGGIGLPYAHSLTFESEFESGNLFRAIQVGDATYDLLLRADIHTQGHTQWFYFAVSNTHPPELVRLAEQGVNVPSVRVSFNIVNFTKPDSLFNLGMRPVTYSVIDAKTKGLGWTRSGSDISYYCNSLARNNTSGEGNTSYYTLSFTLEFTNAKDTVLIAYSYPYSMSDYRNHLSDVLAKPHSENIIRKHKLCTTLAGEDCDLLVITDFTDKERIGQINIGEGESSDENFSTLGSGKQIKPGRESKAVDKAKSSLKPAFFLSARVHPGETPASWMMKGIIDFLTSESPAAKKLRKTFVIFIVPMLNPDGVILGNNRCSLSGVDLNRQWKTPLKTLHPTIYYFKLFMMSQKKIREVAMYTDLHGHSRKYNVFMYGCDDKKRPKPQVRAFPRYLSNHTVGSKYVCFTDCSFHVKKGRESTARVVVAKEVNIPCSFTLEATFCGSNYGPLKNCHMNIGHLQEVGAALCDAFLNFYFSEREAIGKPLAGPPSYADVSNDSIKAFNSDPQNKDFSSMSNEKKSADVRELSAANDDDGSGSDSDDSDKKYSKTSANRKMQKQKTVVGRANNRPTISASFIQHASASAAAGEWRSGSLILDEDNKCSSGADDLSSSLSQRNDQNVLSSQSMRVKLDRTIASSLDFSASSARSSDTGLSLEDRRVDRYVHTSLFYLNFLPVSTFRNYHCTDCCY